MGFCPVGFNCREAVYSVGRMKFHVVAYMVSPAVVVKDRTEKYMLDPADDVRMVKVVEDFNNYDVSVVVVMVMVALTLEVIRERWGRQEKN